MPADDAFFLPDGDRFVATPLTRGPWHAGHQHGGPPAALIARAMETLVDGDVGDWQCVRYTIDFLRPLGIDVPLEVAAHVARRGQQILGLEGAILQDNRPLARATALYVRRLALELPPGTTPPDRPADPDTLPEHRFTFFRWDVGYHTAMEGRRGDGGSVWLRPRHPLIPGASVSPLQRVLLAADAINGVGFVLDLARHSFINADLTIHLHRLPEGTWVQLAATHVSQPNGVGLVDAALSDARGSIGRAFESQVVAQVVPAKG